ncbi:MAG: S41 family peptidase [Thermaerobacter sp.]|nr:S41 family peptidase [Thermaerobacter sp.]
MGSRSWLAVLMLVVVAGASVPHVSYTDQQVPVPWSKRDLIATARRVITTHPAFIGDNALRSKYLAYARSIAKRVRKPLPYWRLAEDEDLVLNYLHDPHTTLWADYSPNYDADLLPVGFYWAKGGLIVYRERGTPAAVHTGDRVLAVGGVPEGHLVRRFERFFGGSAVWIKTLVGEDLPFGTILRWLGFVHQGQVQLLLERPSGARYRLTMALVPVDLQTYQAYYLGQAAFDDRFEAPPGLPEPEGSSFFAWRLTPDYGVFWLTECNDTPAYKAAVDAFFKAVRAAHVHYVVIDLQNNPGGNSAVADALLAHLPIRPKYAGDFGPQAPIADTFAGPVYVLTNASTFSSGVDVAETLSEASDGVLVGQPTGWPSGGWGNVQGFDTPDGIMGYQVSMEFVQALNGKVTPALMPRIPVPLTASDVQQGVNPVAQWFSQIGTPHVHT